jgi:hypothetical protein
VGATITFRALFQLVWLGTADLDGYMSYVLLYSIVSSAVAGGVQTFAKLTIFFLNFPKLVQLSHFGHYFGSFG